MSVHRGGTGLRAILTPHSPTWAPRWSGSRFDGRTRTHGCGPGSTGRPPRVTSVRRPASGALDHQGVPRSAPGRDSGSCRSRARSSFSSTSQESSARSRATRVPSGVVGQSRGPAYTAPCGKPRIRRPGATRPVRRLPPRSADLLRRDVLPWSGGTARTPDRIRRPGGRWRGRITAGRSRRRPRNPLVARVGVTAEMSVAVAVAHCPCRAGRLASAPSPRGPGRGPRRRNRREHLADGHRIHRSGSARPRSLGGTSHPRLPGRSTPPVSGCSRRRGRQWAGRARGVGRRAPSRIPRARPQRRRGRGARRPPGWSPPRSGWR